MLIFQDLSRESKELQTELETSVFRRESMFERNIRFNSEHKIGQYLQKDKLFLSIYKKRKVIQLFSYDF